MNTCLTIWHFTDAPEAYQRLSDHGGDEDWVLHCPAETVHGYWPLGIESVIDGSENSYLAPFGHVDRHVLDNGDIVVIFAHA